MRRTLIAAVLLTGCTVGPNYKRPAVQTPQTFRAPAPLPTDAASLADLEWWKVFKDPELQSLVKTAMVQNYDLRDAVARVGQRPSEGVAAQAAERSEQ